MKATALATVLILAGATCSGAQSRPTAECPVAHDSFVVAPSQEMQIAEVAKRGTVQLKVCGSPKGCVAAAVKLGTPVQIYGNERQWTCGYVAGRQGAGPAWMLTNSLRVVPYRKNPLLKAWSGTWTGSEDHLRIRLGSAPGTLDLVGHVKWLGKSTHFGALKGNASPVANHLHFVESGADSCTVDLTLVGHYILANDNEACGGLNARFGGIWKRTQP